MSYPSTQLASARRGVTTPQMERVAAREELAPETVRERWRAVG
jgi:thiamine biosynthesis protein ThiC